jgi:hypothetical protein
MIFTVIMSSILVPRNPAQIPESCSLFNNLICLHLELEMYFINVSQCFFLSYSNGDKKFDVKDLGKNIMIKPFGITDS